MPRNGPDGQGTARLGTAGRGKGYSIAVWRFTESPFRCREASHGGTCSGTASRGEARPGKGCNQRSADSSSRLSGGINH